MIVLEQLWHVVRDRVIEELAQVALADLRKHDERILTILDKDGNDTNLLESHIIKNIGARGCRTYCIDFTEMPKKARSLPQILLPLVLSKSQFTRDLLDCPKTHLKELVQLIEKGEDPQLRSILIKLLECRSCNEREKTKLHIDYDLSDAKTCERLFLDGIESHSKKFGMQPFFYFRNLPIEKLPLTDSDTLHFIKSICSHRTRIIIIGRYAHEYILLKLKQDNVGIFRTKTISTEKIREIVSNILKHNGARSLMPFTEVSLLVFALKLNKLFGNDVTASTLFQSLTDLTNHVRLNKLDIIAPSTVEKFFATLKQGLPTPRSPRPEVKQYYGGEMERFKYLAEKRGYDPGYYLPPKFDRVRHLIVNGDLLYRSEEDAFVPLRYLIDFKRVNRLLWSLGYKYDRRSRSWIRVS